MELLRIFFLFIALCPLASVAESDCLEADRDGALCCTCRNQTHAGTRCRDECPPNYFLSDASQPCRPKPITTTDSYVSASSENRVVSIDVQLDLQQLYQTSCLPCDVACSGCTGSGPEKCTSCAQGYDWAGGLLGKCIKRTTLVVGVSVGGVFVLVAITTLLLCRRRQRRLHKRDAPEQVLSIGDKASNTAARKETVEEETAPSARPKNAIPVHGNIPIMPTTQDIREGHDKVTRYTKDPTAIISNSRQTKSETADEPLYTEPIQPKWLQNKSANTSGFSNGAFQTDGEGSYENINPELRRSGKRGSQRLCESNIYEEIKGATKGPSESQDEKELTEEHDSGLGESMCSLIKSEGDQLSRPYENVVVRKGPPKIPVFSPSWHFFNDFSADGGVLQGPKSDVYLTIAEGFVLRGNNVTIYGAVCTNLDRVHDHLSLPENESIVSPVVEYCASVSKFKSQVPMCITLPHFVNGPVSQESLKVYCFRRRKQPAGFYLEPLRFVEKGDLKKAVADTNFKKSAGVYYFDNNAVYIQTAHFSGYLCTDCGREFSPPEVHVEVYYKYPLASRLVEVRLYLWDSRFNIKDFKENRPEKESATFSGIVFADVKTLSALEKGVDLTVLELGMRLKVLDGESAEHWKHREDDGKAIHSPESTILLKELGPCACNRPRFPKRVDWQLTRLAASAAAADDDERALECMVQVGYVRSSKDDDVTPTLIFRNRPPPVKFALDIQPSGSATVTKALPSPVINIENAVHVNIAAESSGDQTRRPHHQERNSPRVLSHVYENAPYTDRTPVPDSGDVRSQIASMVKRPSLN